MNTPPFETFHALGYPSILPVIPPGVPVSENSSLYKRLGTPQDARGKLPGIKGRDGKWFSFNWVNYQHDDQDLKRWAGMEAGVGLRTGNGFHAIDADTLDEDCAKIILDLLKDRIGTPPVRIGRYPKALYPVRIVYDDPSKPLPYARIEFNQPDERGNKERVEVLGEGKFFVAHGIHPSTLKPYQWPQGVPSFDDLPTLTEAELLAFMEDLRAALPNTGNLVTEGAGDAVVNQSRLTSEERHVRAAVNSIPNTSQHFPSRESYRDMGYYIKASLPDDEPTAFEIFREWCDRWNEGDNDPGVVAADWRRMKPPFRVGAPQLFRLAETIGVNFNLASVYFEPVPEQQPSPFDIQAQKTREEEAETDTFEVLTLDQIATREPPSFLVARHIPDVSMGFLYSAPGVGKSFLALDLGLTVAHSLPDWHGDPIAHKPDSFVLYIASEGAFDLRNRVAAWHQQKGITTLPDNFLVIERTIDFMRQDDVAKLIRTIERTGRKPSLVFVDTVSRAMPGADENLQKEMTIFVKACDAVKERFSCAVVGVHHAGKSGDMRGSTVLRGAGDFVMRLDREKGASVMNLTMEKQKAAEDGWHEPYSIEKLDLGEGQSSLVVQRVLLPGQEDGEGTASAPVLDLVLRAMKAAWDAGEPWGAAARAGDRYALRMAASTFGIQADTMQKYLDLWVADGTLKVGVADAKKKLRGYEVVRDLGACGDDVADGSGGAFG